MFFRPTLSHFAPALGLALLLIGGPVVAQTTRRPDLIFKRDKAVLEAILVDQDATTLRYRRFANPQAGVFQIRKTEVERLRLSDGTVVVFDGPDVAPPRRTRPEKTLRPEKRRPDPRLPRPPTGPRLSLRVVLGPTAAYPFGPEIDSLRGTWQRAGEASDSVNRFSGTVWPRFTLHGGLLLRYQLSPALRLGTGLVYSQRGGTLRSRAEYRDPVYQLDRSLRLETRYRVDVLDIPLELDLRLGQRLALTLGGGLALVFSEKNTKQIVLTEYRVTTNGHRDEEESSPRTREEFPLAPVTHRLIPSLRASLTYRLRPRWELRLAGQATGALFNTGSQVKNAALDLGLTYQLFPTR